MSRYPLIPIGNVASFLNGLPFKPSDWSKTGHKIIRIQNLTDPQKPYNRTEKAFPEKYIVKKGDVLVSWSGTIDVFIWDREDAVLNQHIFKVKFDHTRIDKSYFIFALKRTIDELSRFAHGSTMKHIIKSDFDNHRIPLPPLPDQIRIANILSKAESLIRQRKESLRLLDEFLKSTFLEMFGDPLRGENLKPLGDHLRLQHGYAFKSKDFINKGIPVIKIGTINKGYFDIESLSYLGDEFTSGYDQYTIQPGDLLISLTGTVGKDDYANTCFVPEIFRKYLLNQRVAKLVPDERFLQKSYLDFAFKYPGLKKRLIRSNRGIRQANLSSNDIYSIRINIPPISEQIHFTSIVERVEVLRGHYISSLQELNNLHGSLSQRAFQAELYLREETLANAAEPEGLYRKTRK